MTEADEKYMRTALRLAKRGISRVEPNPLVGCVIVKNGGIIGRGWHKKFGGSHAEINALKDCKKQGHNPKSATMYVNLEPCCHYGKTEPCADSIIDSDLKKVVVAIEDPSEHAHGKGIRKLRKAGIEVQVGVCKRQAKLLNAPFIKFASTNKTWVVVKWAQTIDGTLGFTGADEEQKWISSLASRKDVHKLRRRVQGILVGIGTVLADDPLLTARPNRGKKPLRIVVDSSLRIPLDCNLLKTVGKVPVLIATTEEAVRINSQVVKDICNSGAEVLAVQAKPNSKGRLSIQSLLDELSKRGVAQLLVEGGPTIIDSFLQNQLVDEYRVYIAPRISGNNGGKDAIGLKLSKSVDFHSVSIECFEDDVCISGLSYKVFRAI